MAVLMNLVIPTQTLSSAKWSVTGQFADKPTHCQSSQTGQLVDQKTCRNVWWKLWNI